MRTFKGMVVGSAAALITVVGAQAADLPVKAKAVEYVKICSAYGVGFYYIPGTDTCIKLSGYLRADAAFGTNGVFAGAYNGVAAANNRLRNYYTARSREDFDIDTRTATEYGVVRTFFDATFSWTTGDPVAGGSLGVYYAFIQFAGFTMGKAISQFSTPWVNYPGNNFDQLVGGGGAVTGVNQLSYTADFGGGVSAAISLQDQVGYYQANIWNTSGATAANIVQGIYGTPSIGGAVSPDVVGMVRVDQAWGLFQASFAAHDNHAAYYGATETTGHPADKWGWAAQAGLSVNNIPTGTGDTANVTFVYTDGATRYNLQDLVPTSFAMYRGTGLAGAYQSLAFAGVADAVFAGTDAALPGATALDTIKTWGLRAGYTHNWNASWNTAIYGAYAAVRYGDTGKALICTAVLPTLVAGSTCNPDFNIGQLGVITRWTPVKNLTFSVDTTWTTIDQKYTGAVVSPGAPAVAKPAATYELKDQQTVSMLFRVQRNW